VQLTNTANSSKAPGPSCMCQAVTGQTGLRLAVLVFIASCFTGCSSTGPLEPSDDAPSNPVDVSNVPNATPRPEPLSRYGNPPSYIVYGKTYYTLPSSKDYQAQGLASWYGTKFHGKRTSSGEPYDLYGMTAAHKTLPLPTYAEVTNLRNGRSVIVKVNDRGPFHDDRLIDLSYTAASKLDILATGTGMVEVRAIDTGELPPTPAPAPILVQTALQESDLAESETLYLQVGAFSSQENAIRMQNEIQAQNIGTVRIVEVTSAGSLLYKVQVGPLASIREADQVTRALKPLGINESRSIVQ
jgi:rare lipoprotein A